MKWKLLAKWKLLVVLAVGVIVLGATAWITYPRKPKRSLSELSNYRYLHCEECGHEFSYTLDGLDKPCPQCGSE
ncbi:MAG TPA: hypothetical protein VKE74_04475, partial [Gemmataceae bacterium]|nr:hypothetical protein [Gemmataceae bacterium]